MDQIQCEEKNYQSISGCITRLAHKTCTVATFLKKIGITLWKKVGMILAKNYDSTSSDCNNFVGCHQWIFLCYCSGSAAACMKNVKIMEIDIL